MLRYFLFLFLSVMLLSCASRRKQEAASAVVSPVAKVPSQEAVVKAGQTSGTQATTKAESPVVTSEPTPGVIQLPPTEVIRQTVNGVDLIVVRFDDRAYDLRVVDQRGGPGSRWATASLAGRGTGALAAINGGFFTPEGDPLGLVVGGAGSAGFWNKVSSLCSGVFVVDGEGPKLVRTRSWLPQRESSELLQAGPFLVEGGKLVGGLHEDEDRARSFLLWDGRHGWAMGYSRSATLQALAKALASEKFKGMRVSSALNLDGGRSADLWVSSSVKGGGVTERLWWNRPVRNFLVLKKKRPVAPPVPVEVPISAEVAPSAMPE